MANQKDVSLVIRAKNEAERTIKAVSSALGSLDGVQERASGSAAEFASNIDQMQNQLRKLEGTAKRQATVTEQLANATSKQAADLISTNRSIQERKARIEELNRAMGILAVEADKAFIGPRRNGLAESIRAIKAELKSAQTSLNGARGDGGLTLQYEKQIAKLGELRGALRSAQSVSREAEGAVNTMSAAVERQTRALDRLNKEQASVTRSNSAQQFFNNKFAPGLERPQNTAADREAIAAVLRVAEARDLELQKTREQVAEQNRLNEARRIAASIRDNTNSRTFGSARESAGVFEAKFAKEEAEAAKQEAAAIEQLRAKLNPLAIEEARVAAETQKLAQWQKQGKITADEQKGATKLLNDELERSKRTINGAQGLDSRGRPSLFGLKPYELQNLSFQINDVVTQIASGTSVTQTLAQQGGQILQLFPRVGSAIAAGLTSAPIIAFTAGLATLVLGLQEVAAESERIRKFGGLLAANVDGSAYDPRKLNDAAEALDRYGLSAEEAVAAVRVFLKEGVDQTQIEQFGRAAKNLADVMGIDLKDAAGQVAEAFTGGFNSVKKLDDAYNFLTAAQLEQIKTLFDQGEAQKALDIGLQAFSTRMNDAADKARGSWSDAFRELGSAWQEFTNFLSDLKVVRGAASALAGLAGAAATAIRSLRNADSAAGTLEELTAARTRLANLEAKVKDGSATAQERANLGSARSAVQILEKQLSTLEAQNGVRQEGSRITAEQTERTRKQSAELKRVADQEREAKTVAEAESAAREKAARYVEDNFKYADQATKNAYIAQQVEEARTKALKKAADEREREARAAKTAADEARRGYIQDIQNNGREEILSTANRFRGFSENNAGQRGDLMSFFRQNGINVDPQMTAWCAAFVNAVLATNGIKGTGSLAARSFLNFGQDAGSNPQNGDIVVLKRGNNDAQGHVGFFQGFDQRGNVKVLGGNQGDKVSTQTFNRDDVLGFRRAPSFGQVATEQAREAEQLAQQQERFNTAIDNQVERRKADTEQMRQQLGLQGEALLAKEREAAIEDAILKAKQDADKAGISQDDPELKARLERIREVEGAYFDLAHARDAAAAKTDKVQQPVDDLTSQRDAIQAQMDFLQSQGLGAEADSLQPMLDGVNAKLREAIQNAITFYQTLDLANDPLGRTQAQIDAVIARLQTTLAGTTQWVNILGVSGQQIAQVFSSQAVNALDKFAQAIANGKNVFSSLKNAFLEFASSFLLQIAKMIQQQIIFNIVSSILRAAGGGAGGGGGSAVSSNIQFAHTGGVVGRTALQTKPVSPAWFSSATRYHSGGIAGLRPDEVPTILQRGEEVLTASDPRHRDNGGMAPNVNLKVVNTIDAGEMVSEGLSTPAGEQAIFNMVRANKRAFREAMS